MKLKGGAGRCTVVDAMVEVASVAIVLQDITILGGEERDRSLIGVEQNCTLALGTERDLSVSVVDEQHRAFAERWVGRDLRAFRKDMWVSNK